MILVEVTPQINYGSVDFIRVYKQVIAEMLLEAGWMDIVTNFESEPQFDKTTSISSRIYAKFPFFEAILSSFLLYCIYQ